MTRIISIIAILLIEQTSFGQTSYEPQILILAPNSIKFDKVFDKEINDLNELYKESINYDAQLKYLNSDELKKEPENIQLIMTSEVEYAKNMNFLSATSFFCEQFLAFRFIEKFPNLMIILKNIKCDGQLSNLKNVSEKYNLQYVLNFSDIEFFKDNQINYAKVKSQLYDKSTHQLLIDSTYIGDWNNPGFEFACNDSSLSCTINNALSQLLENVVYTISSNSPKLKKERTLQKERINEIILNYLNKPFDKNIITNIIPKNDSSINQNNLYQLFVSNDKMKVVGFYVENVDNQNLKQLNDNKQEKNINIINEKDIKDEGYLDNIPQTYAYIVKAVKYKNKWYYEKSNVTYFEPKDNEGGRLQFLNNLQEWGFFKDNSIAFNQDFWETNLFKKVVDLRKDPEWKDNGDTIWKTLEEENRNYIGLYEIVAEQLKGNKNNQPKIIKIN